jgi:preprotein translocase subunit SecG
MVKYFFYLFLFAHFFVCILLLILLFFQQNSKSELSAVASGSIFKNRTDNAIARNFSWIGLVLVIITTISLEKTAGKKQKILNLLTLTKEDSLEDNKKDKESVVEMIVLEDIAQNIDKEI